MLKSAAVFTLNRLCVLAAIFIVMKAYGQSSCQPGGSLFDRLGDVLPGLERLGGALRP